MKVILTTSVSLPAGIAEKWREHRHEIMRYAGRYLRTQMRKGLRRGVTRTYNRGQGEYQIVTTRFTSAEYDTLHFIAASLRVSVSSLIYGLVLLWLKPARRAAKRFFATNCCCEDGKWDPEAGFVEEFITFWRLEDGMLPEPHPRQMALKEVLKKPKLGAKGNYVAIPLAHSLAPERFQRNRVGA